MVSDDTYAHWKALKQANKDDKAFKRKAVPEELRRRNIPFETYNGGVHLRITLCEPHIDFWPSTGKWRYVGTKTVKSGGLKKLLPLLRKNYEKDNS